MYEQFLLPLAYRFYSFPKLPRSEHLSLSLTPFSEVVSYISDTAKLFCHILYSILGCPELKELFNNLHTLKFILYTVNFYEFRQTHNATCSSYHVTQNSFPTLKISPVFVLFNPSSLPWNPSNEWSFKCLYKFVFFIMS